MNLSEMDVKQGHPFIRQLALLSTRTSPRDSKKHRTCRCSNSP